MKTGRIKVSGWVLAEGVAPPQTPLAHRPDIPQQIRFDA